MSKQREIKKETLLKVIKEYNISINNIIFNIYDSSSENVIIGLEDFVIKRKSAVINRSYRQWLELAIGQVCKSLTNYYIQSNRGKYLLFKNNYYWLVMDKINGNGFDLNDKESLRQIIEIVKEIQRIDINSLNVHTISLSKEIPKNDVNFLLENSVSYMDYYINELEKFIYLDQKLKLELIYFVKYINKCMRILEIKGNHFKYTISHGEFQGQNVLIDNDKICKLIDWDSVGIRPRLYDIVMGLCFFCRKSRGAFQLDKEISSEYLRQFDLNLYEKKSVYLFAQICFIPDILTLKDYYCCSIDKANWYIEWCLTSSKELKRQEELFNELVCV